MNVASYMGWIRLNPWLHGLIIIVTLGFLSLAVFRVTGTRRRSFLHCLIAYIAGDVLMLLLYAIYHFSYSPGKIAQQIALGLLASLCNLYATIRLWHTLGKDERTFGDPSPGASPSPETRPDIWPPPPHFPT